MVAIQATPRRSCEVCRAIAPKSGMHSKRGLLRILLPTQMASSFADASALTAISIRSFSCVPFATTARLDSVRPKVVFVRDEPRLWCQEEASPLGGDHLTRAGCLWQKC